MIRFSKLIVLAALACESVSASASTVIASTRNPLTLTYDGGVFGSAYGAASTCPFGGQLDCFNFSLQPQAQKFSGKMSLSFSLSAPQKLNFELLAGAAMSWIPEPEDVQLRFSNHGPITTTYTFTNQATGEVLAQSSNFHSLDLVPLDVKSLGIKVEIEAMPGYYLTPSATPGCAALSCMTTGNDEVNFGMFSIAAAVPEPATNAMLAVGLASLALFARRRRA